MILSQWLLFVQRFFRGVGMQIKAKCDFFEDDPHGCRKGWAWGGFEIPPPAAPPGGNWIGASASLRLKNEISFGSYKSRHGFEY
jgi:hypothetical protein